MSRNKLPPAPSRMALRNLKKGIKPPLPACPSPSCPECLALQTIIGCGKCVANQMTTLWWYACATWVEGTDARANLDRAYAELRS